MTRRKDDNVIDDLTGVEEDTQEPAPVEDNVSSNRIPEADASVREAAVAPVELVVASDSPLTDETVERDAEPQKAKRTGHVTIVYKGDADSFSYGPYKFRPGQPAKMPSAIAEELLSNPFEKFEVKE